MLFMLSACGGGSSGQSVTTHAVGGTVSGLGAGQQVILKNNAGDPLKVTSNGAFNFSIPVADNGSYAVTVDAQPTGQTCTVNSGTGSSVTASVSSVSVTCSSITYAIGGTVSGLGAGQQVTLKNNAAAPLTVTANGAFNFSIPVAYNGSYAVTVDAQPTGQTCTVTSGSGSSVTASVSSVSVTCSSITYAVGGTVSGLGVGKQVTLKNNAADPIAVTANGAFNFVTPVAYNGSYAVTVDAQPTGQTCTVTSGAGSSVTASVSSVSVTCSSITYAVGGTVSGLGVGKQVTLKNNAADPIAVTANGAFNFVTPVAYNGSYAVTVDAQPTGQTCTVTSGAGSSVAASVSSVSVTCSGITYAVGGTVSGLGMGQQVTLKNNGADPITVTTNGTFNFATPVAYNGSYAVTVGTQPTGQICTVNSGSGSNVTASVSSVSVACVPGPHPYDGAFSCSLNGATPFSIAISGGLIDSKNSIVFNVYKITGTLNEGNGAFTGNVPVSRGAPGSNLIQGVFAIDANGLATASGVASNIYDSGDPFTGTWSCARK